MWLLTPASGKAPKETRLKPVDSVSSESLPPATHGQPDSQPMLPVGDQEEGALGNSSAGEVKQSSVSSLSSSCTFDGVSDKSVGTSEILDVKEETPPSPICPQAGETRAST